MPVKVCFKLVSVSTRDGEFKAHFDAFMLIFYSSRLIALAQRCYVFFFFRQPTSALFAEVSDTRLGDSS